MSAGGSDMSAADSASWPVYKDGWLVYSSGQLDDRVFRLFSFACQLEFPPLGPCLFAGVTERPRGR